jgi:signal transduction histidine kinase
MHFERPQGQAADGAASLSSAETELLRRCTSAEDAVRRKDMALALVGHELRNPLAVIAAAVALLRPRMPDDDGVRRAVDIIARQCQHATALTNDLLDVSRASAGKLLLDLGRVDLRVIVGDAVDSRRAQLQRRQHQLTVEFGTEPVWVLADPVRLTQVFSNLMDNAAKFTPNSGHISVVITPEAGRARVDIRDNGVGITPDRLGDVFDAFTQLPASRATSAGGLGLGLAVVRTLTELHGGTVHAASDGAGQGSCFTVDLPTVVGV